MFDDSIKDLLGFHAITLYEEYNSSINPVDILSFDNIFLECDIAQGIIFKGRKSKIFHNWTMTVDPGYKFVEKFSGGISLVYGAIKRHYFKCLFQIKKSKQSTSIIQRSKYHFLFINQRNMKILYYNCLEQ